MFNLLRQLLYIRTKVQVGLWIFIQGHLFLTATNISYLLALVCGVLLWRCQFPIGILGQVWCLIVSIPDLCPFSYLYTFFSEKNGLFELKFHMEYSIDKTISYDICLRLLDQNGHHNIIP